MTCYMRKVQLCETQVQFHFREVLNLFFKKSYEILKEQILFFFLLCLLQCRRFKASPVICTVLHLVANHTPTFLHHLDYTGN